MMRRCKDIENEIIHQILFCELCFDVCNSIKIIPGRGADFLPYFYNLNFVKGIILLHSLLLSTKKSELSIKKYISKRKEDNLTANNDGIKNFEKYINLISVEFKESFPISLRNKIGGHLDENYRHTDFISAYIMPKLVPEYVKITSELKDTFFKFCNHSMDVPFPKLREQIDEILQIIK